MELERTEELNSLYMKLIKWIDSNRGSYEKDESKETIVAFFKYIYENSEKLIIDDNDCDIISVMILDCLFYSLLCDFKDEINNLTTEMYYRYQIDKDMKSMFKDIRDNFEKQFILDGINLFCVGTSLYHDLSSPFLLEEKFEELKNFFPKNKIKLISILKCIVKYLQLYSTSRCSAIRIENLSKFEDCKNSNNPYHIGGFINLMIKYMEDNQTYEDIDHIFTKLFDLIKNKKFPKFNEGYYYLLFARYKEIQEDYECALNKCDYALISTNNNCPRNGDRRNCILNLKKSIITKIQLNEDFKEIEKTKKRLNEYKEEIYKLIGIILPVIVIPISVLIAFLEVNKEQQDVTLVITLLSAIIGSILLTSFLVILTPYIFRVLDNTLGFKIETYLKSKKYYSHKREKRKKVFKGGVL